MKERENDLSSWSLGFLDALRLSDTVAPKDATETNVLTEPILKKNATTCNFEVTQILLF